MLRPLSIRMLPLLACLLLAGAAAAVTEGEPVPPDEGGVVESMGQPPTWMPYGGLGAGVYEAGGSDTEPTGALTLGVFRNIINPIGAVGLAAEGYVGMRGTSADGGVRGMVVARPLRFGLGIDYNIPENSPDLLLSFLHPIRRGGPFGLGGRLRFDYLPTRDHSLRFGFVVPLGQRWNGRTRPRHDHVKLTLPKREPPRELAPDPELARTIGHVRDAADWLNRFSTPFFDPGGGDREDAERRFVERVKVFKSHMAETSPLYPEGRSYPAEIRVYHEQLDRAFSLATGARETTPLGRRVSAAAREILLDEVILPYNRMLGRIKKPDSTTAFAARARDGFDAWLRSEPAVPEATRPAARHVLRELLDEIEECRAGSAKYWDTSELVWIPIHIAKRPDELENQAQIDALLERAVEEPFTDGNEHYYIINEQFQVELLDHIRSAEDYHVLWIHDYRGVDVKQEIDELGYDQVYHGYMRSLVDRVRRYDETGKLPSYMIFLDQNFYEPNRGRLWMSFLEDPLREKVSLPPGEGREEKQAALERAQQELRDAVAASTLLQQRVALYGEDWLHNRIKVHVNITNPVDWSFWSQRILPVLGIPDVLMRDHRKISFYDVTEADPNVGEAIFTGMGVGEHYAGPTWEDRAILVEGPALASLKTAARQMLLNQGFRPEQIPYPLQPRPRPENYDELVAARVAAGNDFRSMQIHNQTGYAPKPIDVAKALLYDVMPAGSILIVPDSLWNSPFWAGMLVGNALRGGHVFVISPALDNAPSSGFPQMSRAQEIFAQMIVMQDLLGEEIAATGGALHTGIYDVDMDVGDLVARTEESYRNAHENPLGEVFRGYGADDPRWEAYWANLLERRERVLAGLAELGFEPGYAADDIAARKPKLHLKAQLFLDPHAVKILREIDYNDIVEDYFYERARQIQQGPDYLSVKELWKSNRKLWNEEGRRVAAAADPEDARSSTAYLLVGSHNMDYRGMLMDGEVVYITTRGGVVPGIIDLFLLASTCDWVDDLEGLNEHLEPYSEWQRRIGRFIKYAL